MAGRERAGHKVMGQKEPNAAGQNEPAELKLHSRRHSSPYGAIAASRRRMTPPPPLPPPSSCGVAGRRGWTPLHSRRLRACTFAETHCDALLVAWSVAWSVDGQLMVS